MKIMKAAKKHKKRKQKNYSICVLCASLRLFHRPLLANLFVGADPFELYAAIRRRRLDLRSA